MASKPPRTSQVTAARQSGGQTSVQIVREGPLPTPEELFRYDQLLPGAADRIIAMAEREQAARVNLDDMAQRADIRHRDELVAAQRSTAAGSFRSDLVGQVLGGLVALACVGGAVYTAQIGAHWSVSVALVSLPVATIVKAVRATSNGNGQKK